MPISPDAYLSFIQKELAPLYFKVKEMNVKAENFDKLSRSYIAPFNEFRSTWDHMFKASVLDDEKKGMENLIEAKVHLYRAGYDVYEIFASDLGLRITDAIERYSSENVARVFPLYYNEFQPKIIHVHEELSKVRSNKNVDGNGDNVSFDTYEKSINDLISIYSNIQEYIPILEKEEKRNYWSLLNAHAVTFAITIIGGLILAYVISRLGWI